MSRSTVIEVTLTLLRVVSAFLFMQYGGMKLFGIPIAVPGGHPVPLVSEMGLAGVLEVVGGALLLLGLLTRPVAFILSGEMAVAYFQGHQPRALWPVENMGVPPILFCFIFLFLAAQGAGRYSLDHFVSSKSEP